MFQVNDDNSIYATRGDIVFFSVEAEDNGTPFKFQAGDVVRIKVYGKKDAETVVLQKDFSVADTTGTVEIFLTEEDTKIGDVISKPRDYWYEIELNPYTNPQTIIGYNEDGPALFKLFPEGDDIPETPVKPEDIPVVDTELDMTSNRPVENRAIARAFENLREGYEATFAAVGKLHVTPQMFGAIGDGVADDTQAIKDAISAIKNGVTVLHFPAGTYLVSEDISLVSDMTLEGEGFNSIIKRAGNSLENYDVIDCNGLENVCIKNIYIKGERSEHEGTAGEWGHCIGIRNCVNTSVKNCKLTDAWGDGVYVGGDTPSVNTVVENCVIDNNRRQGISIINSKIFCVRDCTISNTKGTNPQGGIDFEANNSTDICESNTVENCFFYGNQGASIIIGNQIVPYEVMVKGCTSKDRVGSIMYGFSVEGVSGGYFFIHDCLFKNIDMCLSVYGKSANGIPVRLKDCYLYASASNGVCVEYSTDKVDSIGGFYITDCTIGNGNSSKDPIRIINSKGGGTYESIDIDVSIDNSSKNRVYFDSPVTGNAKVRVGKKSVFGTSYELAQYYVLNEIDLKCTSASRRLTCKESFPYGCPVKVRKSDGTYALEIYAENGSFPQYGKSSFELKKNYDEITITHESSGVWSVKTNAVTTE